jgi:hypothetical protein
MNLNNFQKWMELNTDLSGKSIKSYLGVISKINDYLISNNLIQSPLDKVLHC